MTGSWIRRDPPDALHACDVPQDSFVIPGGTFEAPAGSHGDLWRCDCGRLWRLGYACAPCEYYGHGNHGGQHLAGDAWRPATLGQRIGVWMRRWRQR